MESSILLVLLGSVGIAVMLHHTQLIAHIFEVKFFREMTHMDIMIYSKCLINIK